MKREEESKGASPARMIKRKRTIVDTLTLLSAQTTPMMKTTTILTGCRLNLSSQSKKAVT